MGTSAGKLGMFMLYAKWEVISYIHLVDSQTIVTWTITKGIIVG